MIELTVRSSAFDTLKGIETFGKEWRESNIPADLRRLGVLGAATQVRATGFTMSMRAMQRSPNFLLFGVVRGTPDGGSRITAHLELSSFNRAIGGLGVVVVAWIIGQSNGLVAGLVSGCVIAGIVGGMTAVGRSLAQARFEKLLECALAGIGAAAI